MHGTYVDDQCMPSGCKVSGVFMRGGGVVWVGFCRIYLAMNMYVHVGVQLYGATTIIHVVAN